jgi:hypothetical protein
LQLHQEKKWAEADRTYVALLTMDIIADRASRKVRSLVIHFNLWSEAAIVDSPQSKLQRLVLKNYAQLIVDILTTTSTPETVDSMLPISIKYFAEV